MIYPKRPYWGEKTVFMEVAFPREFWELWQHYCAINGESAAMRMCFHLASAMVKDCPTLEPLLTDQGGGRGERSPRPPAASVPKSGTSFQRRTGRRI